MGLFSTRTPRGTRRGEAPSPATTWGAKRPLPSSAGTGGTPEGPSRRGLGSTSTISTPGTSSGRSPRRATAVDPGSRARMSQQVDPSHIMQVGMGFWASKTLLSAVELELFTQARRRRDDGRADRRGARARRARDPRLPRRARRPRAARPRRRGERCALPQHARRPRVFLDKASPAYIGGILEMANARLYRFWGDLTEALKTGKPQNEIKHTGKPMFDELYSDPDRLEQFMNAMAGISLGSIQRARGEVRLLQVRDALRRGRRNRAALDHRRRPSPAHALHELRPAGRRADREAHDRSRRAERSRDGGGRRLLRRPAAQGRRHHDGADPPRLEPREEDAPDQGRLRRAARGRRVHRRSRTSSTTPAARTRSGC